MEDDLNLLAKWKTSICYANEKQPQFFRQMEDDLNFEANRGRPRFLRQMEDNLNSFVNVRRSQFSIWWKKTSIIASPSLT